MLHVLRVGELERVDADDAGLPAGLDDGADRGGGDDVVLWVGWWRRKLEEEEREEKRERERENE
jgi:hypothetical protein